MLTCRDPVSGEGKQLFEVIADLSNKCIHRYITDFSKGMINEAYVSGVIRFSADRLRAQ